MNFFINQAMGIGNSGVEHAQFYRAKLFEQVNLPYQFVFVELIDNLQAAMQAWNIKANTVINMWEYLCYETNYFDKRTTFNAKYQTTTLIDNTNTHRLKRTLTVSGLEIIEHLAKYPDPKGKKMLLVSPVRTEIFVKDNNERKIMFEHFRDQNRGTLIKNIHLFNYQNKHLFFENEQQLQKFFFKEIDHYFGGHSVFIIDRGEQSEAALMTDKIPNSKIIGVIHADHLSDRDVPKQPLWNNYYEYELTHLSNIDKLVMATKLQRNDLLIDFPEMTNKFQVIPVGGVRNITQAPTKTKPQLKTLKLISVSRLASEKHLELAIKAVASARGMALPVELTIYGQGDQTNKLAQLIEELELSDFVKLAGHTNHVDKEYPKYDAFISASFSEGFGLTFIEALNANLPVITYKARFGALELIKDGWNGILVDFDRSNEAFNITQLTQGIQRLLTSNYQELVKNTQTSILDYQDKVIADKWRTLINEL